MVRLHCPSHHQKTYLQNPRMKLNRRSRILLKLETLQPSGSFKSRGVGNLCKQSLLRSPNPSRVHFFSSSGGNAGLACVHAANSLGRPSTVVVPVTTKPMMIAKIKAAGASEVVQEGKSWREADEYLRSVVMPKAEGRGEAGVYVPPFDHPDVWAGNHTIVQELEGQLGEEGEPDVLVCSVGGGGLFCGIAQGAEEAGWKRTQILAVETQGCNALNHSLQQGENSVLPGGITSQATSLGAVKVADRAYELAAKHQSTGQVKSVVLSDAEAAMGCWRFADDERTLVELSCGVNLALCYGGRLEKALGRPVKPDERVVIVVCGGSVVTTEMVENWRREFGDLDGSVNGDVPSAMTVPNGK